MNQKVKEVVNFLKSEHFRKWRIAAKNARKEELLAKPDKKLNKRQNERKPTYTAIVVDQRQFGKLRKQLHTNDLNTELGVRSILWKTMWKENTKGKNVKLNWTDKIDLLKKDEEKRRGDDEEYHTGFFKPLSTAPFYVPPKETWYNTHHRNQTPPFELFGCCFASPSSVSIDDVVRKLI